MLHITDAPIQQTGPSRGAVGSPTGLPHAPRTVGHVALVAHLLPFEIAPGALPVDADVRAHPHIGLCAMSYVIDGHVTHRDSLGNRHELRPGGVGWTYAGRGAVHSERLERLRLHGGRFQMLQILLALPDGHEDDEPAFAAVPPEEVPEHTADGVTVRRLAGAGTALAYPAHLFLEDVILAPGGRYQMPAGAERAIYAMDGDLRVAGELVRPQQTARIGDDGAVEVSADAPARFLAFGGDAVGPRYSWWNFMHSSLERIEAAKARWRAGEFPLPGGDTESFTPAPPDEGRPLSRLNVG